MNTQQISIIELLNKQYPHVSCALQYSNPLELTIAVILSAQCTDARVNRVTRELFKKCSTINDYINIPLIELEKLIFSTGFYKNKAKNIKKMVEQVAKDYKGEIPDTMEKLLPLAGIGRKTANVILGDVFGKSEGIVVDTHVLRNSYRLGFGKKTQNAVVKEKELMSILPRPEWYGFPHRLMLLGRSYCTARKPNCKDCFLRGLCPRKGVKC